MKKRERERGKADLINSSYKYILAFFDRTLCNK